MLAPAAQRPATEVTMLLPDAAIDLAQVLAHFAEHGYARLGRLMSDEGLAALRGRADDLMMGRAPGAGMFFQLDTETGSYDDLTFGRGYQGPSLNYRKIEKLEKDDLFLSWLRNAVFQRIAQALVGERVVLYRAVLMNKASSGGTVCRGTRLAVSFGGSIAIPCSRSGRRSTTHPRRPARWRCSPQAIARGSRRRSAGSSPSPSCRRGAPTR